MNVAVSWSGGKDSCLALLISKKEGYNPIVLISMINDLGYSRSNGIHKTVLQKQAKAMNIPISFIEAEWHDYEENLIYGIRQAKLKYRIKACIFGDIDILEHKAFEEKICKEAGVCAILPLWNKSREKVKDYIVNLGIKSNISVVKNNLYVLRDILGKPYETLNFKLLLENNVDICGENGEFHTVVYKATEINLDINLTKKGVYYLKDVILCDFR